MRMKHASCSIFSSSSLKKPTFTSFRSLGPRMSSLTLTVATRKLRFSLASGVKTVETTLTPEAKEKRNFRVATVKVSELILGPKDLKEVKVGFFKDDELKIEQEACFILMPHFQQTFHVY